MQQAIPLKHENIAIKKILTKAQKRNLKMQKTPTQTRSGEKTGYGHSTQAYSDGYRISRSTNDGGKTADHIHWTNQNAKKRSVDRHLKPFDVRY